jgi:peptidoglycan hydrolase-like protein with peptidoglycan-binding domain
MEVNMKNFTTMTIPQLRQYAADNGIMLDGLTRKDDIINAIVSAPSTPPGIPAFTLSRVLKVTKPLMKGDDVRIAQEAIVAAGFGVGVDGANGIYGGSTALAVRPFQSMNRLIVNGRVDKFTVQALGGMWEGTTEGK